jgi:hypothetical protein
MSQRLESLGRQLQLEESPIEQYRKDSKIDQNEFKKLAYGPNLRYQERIFDMIIKNKDIFEHHFIE